MKKIASLLILFLMVPCAYADLLILPVINEAPKEMHEAVEKGNFSMDISYPKFWVNTVDYTISRYINSVRNDYLASAKALFSEADMGDYTPHASLDISYSIVNDAGDILSIVFSGYTYLWWAHGSPYTKTFTFRKSTGNLILVQDTKTLERVAKVVRPALQKYLYPIEMSDDSWIAEGTAPTLENYANYSFKTDENGKVESITFYFGAYQVAAYAAGMPSVTLYKNGKVEVNE